MTHRSIVSLRRKNGKSQPLRRPSAECRCHCIAYERSSKPLYSTYLTKHDWCEGNRATIFAMYRQQRTIKVWFKYENGRRDATIYRCDMYKKASRSRDEGWYFNVLHRQRWFDIVDNISASVTLIGFYLKHCRSDNYTLLSVMSPSVWPKNVVYQVT